MSHLAYCPTLAGFARYILVDDINTFTYRSDVKVSMYLFIAYLKLTTGHPLYEIIYFYRTALFADLIVLVPHDYIGLILVK